MMPHTHVAICLCHSDEESIRQFLIDYGIRGTAIRRELHITAYQADCVFPGVISGGEEVQIEASVAETRFMVMVGGGEVYQPWINPNTKRIGIRFTRRNCVMQDIDNIRVRFAKLETMEILGDRKQTTVRRSAFGIPKYQPHMTLLNPENGVNGVNSDLTILGQAFRSRFQNLTFDRLEIDVRCG